MLKWIRRHKPSPADLEHYKVLMEASEQQKQQSRRELIVAREFVEVLSKIREENHIVSDLRKVFGGH